MTAAIRVHPVGVVAIAGSLGPAFHTLSAAAPRVSFGSVLSRQTAGAPGTSALSLSKNATNSDSRPRADMRRDVDDARDPVHRRRAALSPVEGLSVPVAIGPFSPAVSAGGQVAPSSVPPASLEELIPVLVRRIAWTGDRHRGSVRLELGAGELAGATLLVHADGGRVRVHIDAPPGADTLAWQHRISQRLASRGVLADSVEVT